MVRVLKPGGVIAVHAPDWGGFLYAPQTTGVVAAVEYYMKLQVEKGGDPYAGRKLKALLHHAGVYDLDVRLSFDMDDPVAAAGFLAAKIGQSVEEGAVEKGWVTQGEVEQMIIALENELGADPAALWAPTRCEILGKKAV